MTTACSALVPDVRASLRPHLHRQHAPARRAASDSGWRVAEPRKGCRSSTRATRRGTMASATGAHGKVDKDEYDSKWQRMWTEGERGLQPGDAFDAAKASQALVHAMQTGAVDPQGKRVLVPGCGRGYDVEEFVRFGAAAAVGLEIAPAAVAAANAYLAGAGVEPSRGAVQGGDFFAYADQGEQFHYGYDYTYITSLKLQRACGRGTARRGVRFFSFLCALHPDMRPGWAEAWSKLIAPGGELITLIFPVVDKVGGPPWAVSPELYAGLLQPLGFEKASLEPVPEAQSHPGRAGKEFFARWRKVGPKL